MKITISILLALQAIIACAWAQEFDYYVETLSTRTECQITLNGFPVFSSPAIDNVGKSQLATPFLIDGTNILRCETGAGPGTVDQSVLNLKVRKLEHGVVLTEENGVDLLDMTSGSSRIQFVHMESGDPGEVIYGEYSAETGKMSFAEVDGLGLVYAKKQDFGDVDGRLPDFVDFLPSSVDIDELELLYLDDTDQLVAAIGFQRLESEGDEERYARGPFTLGGESDISGAAGIGLRVSASELSLVNARVCYLGAPGVEEVELEVSLPITWAWQTAEVLPGTVVDGGAAPADLVTKLQEIVNAFEIKSVTAICSHFEVKAEEHARALYADEVVIKGQMQAFFQNFVSTAGGTVSVPDWGDIRVDRINDRVVRVYRADESDVLIVSDGSQPDGRSGIFRIPLYLAKIGGSWEVVR